MSGVSKLHVVFNDAHQQPARACSSGGYAKVTEILNFRVVTSQFDEIQRRRYDFIDIYFCISKYVSAEVIEI